ncbi:MAG: hypothetical protein H6672_14195 [Anaerolineaceae bacterium]|nr:hypothetical protein [Anaerolineaceae bacterium]
MNETVASRPLPKRPEYGLLAWQATVGYLHTHYRLDAELTIFVGSAGDGVGWSAQADWGRNHELVKDRPSFPQALKDLWGQVAARHVIFESKEALIKRPANYSEHEWLDSETEEVLDELVRTASEILPDEWLITLTYRPVESPDLRWRAQLDAESLHIEAHQATLRDTCRSLYRSAAPEFATRSGKRFDDRA